MNQWQRFDAICQTMADPGFYPHSVSRVERRDTHISSVFLTGKWVYKLKKPVDFGFLDFRQLDDRRYFCKREVTLNRRLSQGIYQEVIAIYEIGVGKFSLKESGQIVEYAVKMRQLPDAVTLRELVRKNEIRPEHMKKLGQTLAAFYERSQPSPQIDHYGHRDVIAFNMEENFRQLEPFVGEILDREKWEFLCQVSRSFLDHHGPLFDHRVETGRIRDGHGDLRTDHIYFCQSLQIIDCIEFNDRFRYGDAVVDLAFLHMDMEHLGYSEWSRAFLVAYVDEADDLELYALIDFYATYRALVRLKVAALRCGQVETAAEQVLRDEAERYIHQAYQYAIQFSRPTLWVFCGLPAAGKSSLAEAVADILSISLFQSDPIRKERQPDSNEKVVPFGKGLYRPGMRQRVYVQLLALAHETLKGGPSVILDATFSRHKWRDEVQLLAADLDASLIFAECFCKEETIRARLKQRETTSSLSDARLQHFSQMLEDFEPLVEIPPEVHVRIDTDQPRRDALSQVVSKGYAYKCQQAKKLL